MTTVPVRSANRSATSPSKRPPTLSIATWIWAPSAAARTRSFQSLASVAKTGDPGNAEASVAAPALLRTSLITLTPRSVRTLLIRRPTADLAPVSSMTTPVRASGGSESCAARITVRAVTVFISICAATSSEIESGSGTTELADTTISSLQVPAAGKKATLRPSLNPRAGSRSSDLAHNAGAFKSGHPPGGTYRGRCSECRRAHDAEKVAWMDRRARQPDADLIGCE